MTINTIQSMHKDFVVAGLYYRSADFVVSICPIKYIKNKLKEGNM